MPIFDYYCTDCGNYEGDVLVKNAASIDKFSNSLGKLPSKVSQASTAMKAQLASMGLQARDLQNQVKLLTESKQKEVDATKKAEQEKTNDKKRQSNKDRKFYLNLLINNYQFGNHTNQKLSLFQKV